MDVTDILRDRLQEPAGLQKMVSVSLLLHGALIAGLLLAPRGLFIMDNPNVPHIELGAVGMGATAASTVAISAPNMIGD